MFFEGVLLCQLFRESYVAFFVRKAGLQIDHNPNNIFLPPGVFFLQFGCRAWKGVVLSVGRHGSNEHGVRPEQLLHCNTQVPDKGRNKLFQTIATREVCKAVCTVKTTNAAKN